MNRQLLELYREFLPRCKSYSANDPVNSISVSSSVTCQIRVKDGKETNHFFWDSNFKVRIDGTTIRLHPIEHDVELIHMEGKLNLLSTMIREFIKESKLRHRNKDLPMVERREWLNGDDATSGYTGYCYYRVDPTGGGKFFIADCSSVINILVYGTDVHSWPGKTSEFTKSTYKTLMAVDKAINTWKNKRRRLVRRYKRWDKYDGDANKKPEKAGRVSTRLDGVRVYRF